MRKEKSYAGDIQTVFRENPGIQWPLSKVPIVLKSGSLNILEPSGSIQACNGIALPFRIWNIFI
jgi:hypothetical protein